MTRVHLYLSTEYAYENKTKNSTMPENQRVKRNYNM